MIELFHKNGTIKVWEYGEARDIIRALSIKYRDDYTIIKSGRKKTRTAYYNQPIAFDIETTTIVPGMLDYTKDSNLPPIAFPYLFQLYIYGEVIFCRQYEEIMDVFSWICEYFRLDETTHMVIFDHNLGYEWSFFRDLWDIDPEASFCLDEHHPVTLALTNGLIIRDSYKMTNMSLYDLTKDWSKKWIKEPELMDYKKIRTPYDELDTQTMLYAALDVLSLSDAIVWYLRARGEEIWTRCPTSTSFIRFQLKDRLGIHAQKRTPEQKTYQKLLQDLKMDFAQYQLVKDLARGGNTHANRAYTGKVLHDLCHYDITSSYPTQMVCYPEYPISAWVKMDNIEISELLDMQKDYCIMCKIALINPRVRDDVPVTVPYIATAICSSIKGTPEYGDNGRYLRGSEQLVLSVFGIELPVIISQYDFDDAVVLECYASHKGYLPDIIRKFVLDLYKKKTEYKGIEEKAVEYALAKTYVNGVYGMMYTDPIRTCYTIYGRDICKDEDKEETEERLRKYQDSKSYFLPYVWGAMTACLGRLYLQKMIDAAGDSFVYADTDSIFAIHHRKVSRKIKELEMEICEYQRLCGMPLTFYDKKGRPHELGGISEEPFCEEFRTWGAKKYVTIENGVLHCTIAGVPKKKGAAIIGNIYNFKPGLIFDGETSGKNAIFYMREEDLPEESKKIHDSMGRDINIKSCAAMLPCSYLLGITDEYANCLSVEGIGGIWDFLELGEL